MALFCYLPADEFHYLYLRTTSLTLTVSGLESVIIDGARNECLVIKDFSLQCILYRLEGAIKVVLDFEATSELRKCTSK